MAKRFTIVFVLAIAAGLPILSWPAATIAQQTTDSATSTSQDTNQEAKGRLLLVVGANGKLEFGEMFNEWAAKWRAAAIAADFDLVMIDQRRTAEPSSYDELKKQIEAAESLKNDLWIVMIGHGTFDGAEAKFNLAGQDVSATDLNSWLATRKSTTIVVNCASASGPFCDILKGPNRVVLASTRNGYESNFSRFGQFLADAISETGVDLDKDDQTSLLEAAIVANGKTAEFYREDSRLATEHSIIEDNGDGKGTPLDWFTGVRVTRSAKDGSQTDGLLANQVFLTWNDAVNSLSQQQMRGRDQLERQVEQLRTQKSKLTEDQYYAELESLMLRLSTIYDEAKSGNRP